MTLRRASFTGTLAKSTLIVFAVIFMCGLFVKTFLVGELQVRWIEIPDSANTQSQSSVRSTEQTTKTEEDVDVDVIDPTIGQPYNQTEDFTQPNDNFASRRALLQKACDKYRGNYYRPQHFALFGSDEKTSELVLQFFVWKERLYLARVPFKAGSNSWHQLLVQEDLYLPAEECVEICQSKNLEKVIVQVRHPLERVISTYRHLFKEEGWRLFLRENITSPVQQYLDENPPSWTDFVTEIILKGALSRQLSLDQLHSEKVRRFETVLLSHWAPYWFLLSPCRKDIFPDYIFKVETLKSDFDILHKQLEFPERFHLGKIAPHGLHKPDFTNTSDLARKHYAELTKTQVRELYEMYKIDHEMFGYSPHKYIQYAKGL